MQTIVENTAGIKKAVSLRKIDGLGERYNKGEKQISCFFEYDRVNKLPYKESPFAKSRVLKRMNEVLKLESK